MASTKRAVGSAERVSPLVPAAFAAGQPDDVLYRRLHDHEGEPGWTPTALVSGAVVVTIMRAYARLTDELGEHFRQFGLTQPYFNVLMLLYSADHRQLPMHEIARGLHVGRFNVTRLIDRMHRDGLVERIASTTDRRVIYVRLAPTGAQRFQQCLRFHWRRIDAMMSALPVDEQEHLVELLSHLHGTFGTWRTVPAADRHTDHDPGDIEPTGGRHVSFAEDRRAQPPSVL
jgi:MarR family 2-MHQ and catechol resistance regulon transcriptional repressor